MMNVSIPSRVRFLGFFSFLLAGAIAALTLAGGKGSVANPAEAEHGFSFVTLGDTRPLMYLPYKKGQPEIHKAFLDLFDLVLPQKVRKR
jgi:hypothetical protein